MSAFELRILKAAAFAWDVFKAENCHFCLQNSAYCIIDWVIGYRIIWAVCNRAIYHGISIRDQELVLPGQFQPDHQWSPKLIARFRREGSVSLPCLHRQEEVSWFTHSLNHYERFDLSKCKQTLIKRIEIRSIRSAGTTWWWARSETIHRANYWPSASWPSTWRPTVRPGLGWSPRSTSNR